MHQQIKDLESANCNDTDMAPVNKFIDKIKETTKLGDIMIDNLDNVIFYCCSKDCTLFSDCINKNTLYANNGIKIYRDDFKILNETGSSLKKDNTHFQCFGKLAVNILQIQINQVYSNATQCILSHMAKV